MVAGGGRGHSKRERLLKRAYFLQKSRCEVSVVWTGATSRNGLSRRNVFVRRLTSGLTLERGWGIAWIWATEWLLSHWLRWGVMEKEQVRERRGETRNSMTTPVWRMSIDISEWSYMSVDDDTWEFHVQRGGGPYTLGHESLRAEYNSFRKWEWSKPSIQTSLRLQHWEEWIKET